MPPLAIEFSPRFKAATRALPEGSRQQVADAVAVLRDRIGQPHLHSGAGIRRLFGGLFECRVSRDLRLVFDLEGHTATLLLVGNHNDVRRFLKNA